jgi:glycosyltransferase involved in cell wall biosynthesis
MIKKQNIALCHFRIGETDGVSLEMDKWKVILEKLGHHVIYIAGSKGSMDDVEIIEELHYNDANNNKIVDNAYNKFHSFENEQTFKNKIENIAESIEQKLKIIIEKNKIDTLIVNNIFSLGWNISAGIGFFNAIKKIDVKCICHHHDFHWEREKYSNPTLPFIGDYLKEYFPPKHSKIKHVVINSIAKNELLKRKNIESKVVPNVFDFDNVWNVDDFNFDFRESFGIKNNDLIILQATRIVKRKGIELAIDFVSELSANKHKLIGKKLYNNQLFTADSKIVFLMVGLNEDNAYFEKIMKYAHEKQVVIKCVNENIDHVRSQINNSKTYSLWDAYAHCDIVTYTSLLEGWGNQFIEALVAKKIIISYQYPVFEKDILPLKFNTIDLGNKHTIKDNGLAEVAHSITAKAVDTTVELILNEQKYDQNVVENYIIGKQNLSLESLKILLKSIIENEE